MCECTYPGACVWCWCSAMPTLLGCCLLLLVGSTASRIHDPPCRVAAWQRVTSSESRYAHASPTPNGDFFVPQEECVPLSAQIRRPAGAHPPGVRPQSRRGCTKLSRAVSLRHRPVLHGLGFDVLAPKIQPEPRCGHHRRRETALVTALPQHHTATCFTLPTAWCSALASWLCLGQV